MGIYEAHFPRARFHCAWDLKAQIQLSNVQGIKQTEAAGKKELNLCTCWPSEWLTAGQILTSLILTASVFFSRCP